VKRETRVTVQARRVKWQFKRADQDRWDYEDRPTADDWNTLEEILVRRGKRGRQMITLERVRAQRKGV
jgi:hypothetical protein